MTLPTRRTMLEIVGVVVLLLGVAAALAWLPAGDMLLAAADQLRGLGVVGAVLFALAYACATVLLVPATPFPLAAGFLYGPGVGFAAAWLAEMLGAVACWALGRGLLRERARALMHRYAVIRAMDHALAAGDLRLLTLLRMSPVIPFGVLNYTLGLAGVRPGAFLISTGIGVIPLALMLAYAGSTLTHIEAALEGEAALGDSGNVVYWLGLVATLVAFAMVSAATRRALHAELEQLD